MRRALIGAFLVVMALAASCGGSGSSSGGGVVNIVLWHGYVDTEGKAMTAAANEFNATHPKIHITVQNYGNSDYALQKVLTAIRAGSYPDIVYLYGSWAANVAQTPRAVDLKPMIQADPSIHWNDFWPAAREAVSVDGKIVGIPALIDNLALVYNKKLFKQAGLAYPTANWTWADLRSAAKKLTNSSTKQFGWAYVNDASEDTVWRFDALLWQAGGDILTPDQKHAAFNSPAGVRAATLLQQMAAQDHSVYLDSGNDNYANLFNSGKIGMLYTGPWDLSSFPNVDYGVQILPRDLNHQTISGPDQWVMLNNGDTRVQAAWTFLKWFTSPAQVMKWSLATGDLPTRASVVKLPQYKQYLAKYKGIGTFVANLNNALKARPVLTNYNEISAAMGQAIQAVLLGKAQPKQALDSAANQVNQILASGQ